MKTQLSYFHTSIPTFILSWCFILFPCRSTFRFSALEPERHSSVPLTRQPSFAPFGRNCDNFFEGKIIRFVVVVFWWWLCDWWCDCVIDSYILMYIYISSYVFICFWSTNSGTRSLFTWQKHVKIKHNGSHIVFCEAWRVCGAKERESMFTSSFQWGWLSG